MLSILAMSTAPATTAGPGVYLLLIFWFFFMVMLPFLFPIILALCGLRSIPVWVGAAFLCFFGFLFGIFLLFIPAVQQFDGGWYREAGGLIPAPDASLMVASFFGGPGCLIAACIPKSNR
jgi:hypothetical protein